jgi:hypothetical protein
MLQEKSQAADRLRSPLRTANPDDRPPFPVARSKLNFHHLLKAREIVLRTPIQIILPMTYDKGARQKQKARPTSVKELQDEATKAWNLHTALYYKAGGLP